MTVDTHRIIAETFKVNLCPLYRAGESFIFRPPAVWVEGNLPVCAVAIEKFMPMVRKIQKGKAPEEFSGVSCGGCSGGEAWFRFRFRREADVPEGLTVGQRTLEALGRSQIFAHIETARLQQVVPLLREVKVPAGRVLLSRGTAGPGLFIVIHGRFEVIWHGDEGRDITVAEIQSGECIGEVSALLGSLTTATVRAADESTVVQIPKDSMDALTRIMPELPMILARVVASRLIRASHRLRAEFGKGWRGRLDSIDPAEMVQSLAMGNQSGTLRVRRGEAHFVMRLVTGRVGDISLGERRGLEAFSEFLGWNSGVFQFDQEEAGTAPPDYQDAMTLLMEVMRKRDETKVTAINPEDLPGAGA